MNRDKKDIGFYLFISFLKNEISNIYKMIENEQSSKWNWEIHFREIIKKQFHADPLFYVRHQLDNFNNFISIQIPQCIKEYMPLIVVNGNWSFKLDFTRVYISKPLQRLPEGFKPLLPNEARLRDLNYSGPLFVDYVLELRNNDKVIDAIIEHKVPLTRIPIMLNSMYCHLHGKNPKEREAMGESLTDLGGYFVLNGNEKVIIAQERPVDNNIMSFEQSKSSALYSQYVSRSEINSSLDQQFHPIKRATILITQDKPKKKGNTSGSTPGHKIHVKFPFIKKDIPLFVAFRAYGILTDREIISNLVGDMNSVSNDVLKFILPSAEEGNEIFEIGRNEKILIRTQHDALYYISQYVNLPKYDLDALNEIKSDDKQSQKQKQEQTKITWTKGILDREFLPHTTELTSRKIAFLSYMVRRTINATLNPSLYGDRDSYLNKRVDTTGPLLLQIFRFNFQKLLRELKVVLSKELNGSKILNHMAVRKTMQRCTIESKLKYALATGNWHTAKSSANVASKKGIAQVLQCLSLLGRLSHLRKAQSPLERSGSKQEAPRRFHATQLGKICMNETPEGQQVGIVKNLAMMCHITINSSNLPIRFILSKIPDIIEITQANPVDIVKSTAILINGDLTAIILNNVKRVEEIYKMLKIFKINNKISKFTSISWVQERKEILIYTDGGRYSRPLLLIDDMNNFKIENFLKDQDKSIFNISWDDLLNGENVTKVTNSTGSLLEYVDTYEDENNMYAIFPYQLIPGKVYELNTDNKGKFYIKADFGISLSIKDQALGKDILNVNDYGTEESVLELIRTRTPNWFLELIPDFINNLEVRFQDIPIFTDIQQSIADLASSTSTSTSTSKRILIYIKEHTEHTELLKYFLKHLNQFIYPDYIKYTHHEIHPCTWFGAIAQTIPFSDHNQSPRNCYYSSMVKQSMGQYVSNYHIRMDTMANVLCYPQKPLVQTFTAGYTGLEISPHGYESIVAVLCYSGFGQEDSTLMNKSGIQRGLMNSMFYRAYTNKIKPGKKGSVTESFAINPKKDNPEITYALNADGFPILNTYVHTDVQIIGKIKAYSNGTTSTSGSNIEDVSTTVRQGEEGFIDWVIPNKEFKRSENADGHLICKVRIAQMRIPEIGDKFASRSAQKGTVGMTFNQSDMPVTMTGMSPDQIMNPHAYPSRMTVGQIVEAPTSKASVLNGIVRDATPFTKFDLEEIRKELAYHGFQYSGNETMYNGQTGELIGTPVNINPTYYMRLKHMVQDKIHARSVGPVQKLTRQPTEGRSRDGGLRIGEMERDCFISHGISKYLVEKMLHSSDIYKVHMSRQTGMAVTANPNLGIYKNGNTDIIETDELVNVIMPWASNLYLNELKSMLIKVVHKFN